MEENKCKMHDNKLIFSVKIIHHELVGFEYRLLADYFRLVGSFICDCTLKTDPKGDFDVVVIIDGDNSLKEKIKQLKLSYPNAICLGRVEDSSEEGWKNYLTECLQKIKVNSTVCSEEDFRILKEIAYVYIEYDLMRARVSFSYFVDEKKENIQKAQDKFVGAYLKLFQDRTEDAISKSKYLMFTRIDLARLSNETCVFLRQELLFDTKKCMEQLDQLLKMDVTFVNAYVLKGFLAELDRHYKEEAKAYYQKAIDQIGEQPYSSYVCYRQGRFYEKVEGNWNEAEKYYRKAYTANKLEYRAIYKIMQIELQQGKWLEAIESCKNIINILNKKYQENYLQEKEYEYLFKSYHEMGIIYERHLNNREEAEKAFRKRREVCDLERMEKQNELYIQIFGEEESKKYLKMTQTKLKDKMENC